MAKDGKNRVYYSSRGIPLIYSGEPPMLPTLTLECYSKWYGVEMIHPNGAVESVHPDVFSEVSKLYPDAIHGDHNFQPAFLYRLAEFLHAQVDLNAIEMAGARWLWEQDDNKFFDRPKN